MKSKGVLLDLAGSELFPWVVIAGSWRVSIKSRDDKLVGEPNDDQLSPVAGSFYKTWFAIQLLVDNYHHMIYRSPCYSGS